MMWFELEPEVYEDLCPPDCDCDQDDEDREYADIVTAVRLGVL